MFDRSTVIKKIVGIQEHWAVETAFIQTFTHSKRVEDWAVKLRHPYKQKPDGSGLKTGRLNYVILSLSAEADIVCVDAVSTAV